MADGGLVLQSVLSRHKSMFNVGHLNCGSINPSTQQAKLDEIRTIMRHQLLSVLAVSETWLHGRTGSKGSSDKSVQIKGYKIYRNDRVTRTVGGGVAIYVLKHIPVKIVANSDGSEIEYLFAEVKLRHEKVLIAVVYRPPSCVSDISSLDALLSTLSPLYQNIIIVGDFNRNLLDVFVERNVCSFFNGFGLNVKHNNLPTHFNVCTDDTLLDYFVVGSDIRINVSNQFWAPSVSHHAFIFASFRGSLTHNLH